MVDRYVTEAQCVERHQANKEGLCDKVDEIMCEERRKSMRKDIGIISKELDAVRKWFVGGVVVVVATGIFMTGFSNRAAAIANKSDDKEFAASLARDIARQLANMKESEGEHEK